MFYYQTRQINSILQLTQCISIDLGENKNRQIKKFSDLPDLVDPKLDPAHSRLKKVFSS
jgi:hypothetical protein